MLLWDSCQGHSAGRTTRESSHFAVPILRALLDNLDLRRRQVEQVINARIELRLQPHDLGVVLEHCLDERRPLDRS